MIMLSDSVEATMCESVIFHDEQCSGLPYKHAGLDYTICTCFGGLHYKYALLYWYWTRLGHNL